MGTVGSHPSPFKGYSFGLCPACGRKAFYKGWTRNRQIPTQYVRCRVCGYEQFGPGLAPGLKSI